MFSLQTPIIMTASSDLDSSVMIASVKEFYNPHRRGATMRMNSEGVNFVSNSCLLYKYTYLHTYIMYVLQVCS